MDDNQKKPAQVGRPERENALENKTSLLSSSSSLPQTAEKDNNVNSTNGAPALSAPSKTAKGKKNERSPRCLKPHARTRGMAAKFYEEQLPFGVDYLISRVRTYDKDKFRVLLFMHNQDENEDGDLWVKSCEKMHFHMLVEGVPCGKDKKKRQFTVNAILRDLGVVFRPGIDDKLWENRGVETLNDFSGYALYATHETPKAKQNGLKFEYDLETMWANGLYSPKDSTFLKTCEGIMVSNLTLEEVKEVREGYTRLNLHKRVTFEDLEGLDKELFELGKAYGDIDTYIDNLPFSVRSHCKMRTLKESYDRGLSRRLEEDLANNKNLLRLCVFVQGQTGTGKTYGALKALSDKRVLTVGGQKTGKFDNLKPSTQAIVIDDDTLPNALQMSDDYPCRAYRRNSNNPVWCGDYLIITSNLTFDEWLKSCGFSNPTHLKAMHERFFICHIESVLNKNALWCDEIVKRGTAEKVQMLVDKFTDFQEKYNESLASYRPASSSVIDKTKLNKGVTRSTDYTKLYEEYEARVFEYCSKNNIAVYGLDTLDVFIEKMNDKNVNKNVYFNTVQYKDSDGIFKSILME